MATSIEIKLTAKPGAFARMYVEFGKLDIIPSVLEKGTPDADGSQLLIVEFDEEPDSIHAVLEHLSGVDFLKVVKVSGSLEPVPTEVEVTATAQPLSETKEEIAPTTDKPTINIFDNHKGRRDKF